LLRRDGERLIASPPPNIAGKLEVRGIGIVDIEHSADVPVALLVELTSDIQRLPDDNRERVILGVPLPIVSIDAMAASAPSKVALALDRMGLKLQ
jgi:serine kinase of HPr protein (carbohydrate metabolism regulator)